MGFSQKDGELTAQAGNFAAVLAANPAAYQQSPETALAVTAAVNAFVESQAALNEARANGVRSEALTATRNANRTAMLNLLRPIYLAVQASASIDTADKIALGIHIRNARNTSHPAPTFAPVLSVVKVDGSVVTLRISDPADPAGKRLPQHTAGIAIFSHVGDNPPACANDFRFEATTGRTTVSLQVPPTVAPGAAVYYTAFYFNPRKQNGPASTPIRATVGAGTTMSMLKLAA